jgi:hypothetical protein
MVVLTVKGDSCIAKEKASTGTKPKKLNLVTYKYHALSDYAETIQRFGPTDNYNMQIIHLLISPVHYC